MRSKHIAFCLEQAYGHIIPTLGIAIELMRRGHKVSYPVVKAFAPLISSIQAHPVLIEPLETREQVVGLFKEDDPLNYNKAEFSSLMTRLSGDRTTHSLGQLQAQYESDKPDLVIHDDCLDRAGRTLADRWGIAKIRHMPQFIEDGDKNLFLEDKLILVTVPRFFQRRATAFDDDPRFQFVGFIPEGRKLAFRPWQAFAGQLKPVLASPTTGLMKQYHLCRLVIEAFRNQPWDLVLSISGSHDSLSTINPEEFSELPANIRINYSSANLDVMETSSLYIGQGGQGGTLEAIYCGIPQILIPPTPAHFSVAQMVAELGLGAILLPSACSKESLIECVSSMLQSVDVLQRAKEASHLIRSEGGKEIAADAIERYLS